MITKGGKFMSKIMKNKYKKKLVSIPAFSNMYTRRRDVTLARSDPPFFLLLSCFISNELSHFTSFYLVEIIGSFPRTIRSDTAPLLPKKYIITNIKQNLLQPSPPREQRMKTNFENNATT